MLRASLAALAVAVLCTMPVPGAAQAPLAKDTTFAPVSDPTWRLPLRPTRIVRFTTTEGTWMSVDVSPDGRTIVFDHLGDIYTLPIGGGTATRILGGMALEVQPRFSPDGRRILYVSDRTGRDQIWTADPDGGNPRQITRAETGPPPSQPIWTPDGMYIVANGMMYHVDGGSGVRIGGTGTFAPAGGSHAFSPDGRHLYYPVSRTTGAAPASVARFQIARLDRQTGQISVRTGNSGGAFKPMISPDGKYLLYATRHDGKTALLLRDLVTSDDTWLVSDFQHDASERSASLGHLPNAAFLPDGSALIASTGGKLWRIGIPDGRMTPIPLTVNVEQHLGPLVHFEYTIPDSFTVRQIRDAVPSPDGRQLAFTALNRLYVVDLTCGAGARCAPRRVTQRDDIEVAPAWSPDGRHLAFATWHDSEGGHLYRVPAGGGAPERLTRVPAAFTRLAYAPPGDRIVFITTPRRARMGITDELLVTVDGGVDLAWIPATGGDVQIITALADQGDLRVALATVPHFVTSDSGRVYYGAGGAIHSIRFDGLDRRTVVQAAGTTVLSPAGDRAVNSTSRVIRLFAVPQTGSDSLTISVTGTQVPNRLVSRTGGEFVGWSQDGRFFYYAIGRSFFRYDVARGEALVRDSVTQAEARRAAGDTTRRAGAADSTRRGTPAYEPERFDVEIRMARETPRGAVVLRGGRIITMRGTEVIPSGDVVVVDNRIVGVGPRGRVAVPAGARVIDVSGKTIIPGYVDIHGHEWAPWLVHKQDVPGYQANLAFGVTTMRDPQTSESDIITYSDREAVGDLLAPRMFTTGPGVFSADNIRSLEEAREVLRRYADHFQTQTLKQYVAGDRRTRQFVIMAARELGITPTTEGAGDFKMSISEFLDGYSGHQHAFEIFPIYDDVARLAAASGITYTPTLGVAYGGPPGREYWFAVDKPHENAKLRRFFYHPELDRRTLRRGLWASEEQFIFRGVAAGANRILEAGGRTGLGSHGELQGLAAHWEMWMLEAGGMSNHNVLRTATILGAEAIGVGKLLGSIEPGKLADLQVLDANPLTSIRNTTAMRYVMKNGRLYDAETLDEVWPVARKAAPRWWEAYDPPVPGGTR